MNSFKNRVKYLVGRKTQTQEVAKVGEAGEPETAQDALVLVKQPSELAAVPVGSTSTANTPKPLILETSRYNFKIVHDPPQPIVDIIFIHGLTGDREKTWTRTKGKQSCFWPQDLLAEDIPNARIAVWGYDASVIKKTPFAVVSTNTLEHHAHTLCSDVATLRGEKHKQPIIFITHSLGGLVCKTAILHASEAQTTSRSHLKDVFTSTNAIAFMGTPHQGSAKASWGIMLASALGYVKQDNVAIVETFEKESPHLNDLQERFVNMLENRKQAGEPIDITCFYEEMPLPVFGTIVPSQSAKILGYKGVGIPADHSGMTKFATGGDDHVGYTRVLGEVERWVGKIELQAKTDGTKEGEGIEGKGKGKESVGRGTVTHVGNVGSGGVLFTAQSSFQNSGVTNIGGVHTVHGAAKEKEGGD